MNPNKHWQPSRLGINIVLCECFLAWAHDEKVQALELILTVVWVRQV